MGKQAKSATEAGAKDIANAALPGALNPGTIAALMDIASRSGELSGLYAEKFRTGEAFQEFDPQGMAGQMQQLIQQAAIDPAPLIKEQSAFATDLAQLWQRFATDIFSKDKTEPIISPAKQDKRFKDEAWSENPVFDYLKQSYLLMSRYAEASVRGMQGIDPQAHKKAQFFTRQFVNALSPTNFVMTNPAVLQETMESGGTNLVHGLRNLVEDLERGDGRLSMKMVDLEAFRLGEDIANTLGEVVFQNDLMQLIQYAPSTPTVQRRPLLIIPPWINKFYILDLKPKNSFIKWCVDQGHTVFVIAWVNPGPELSAKNFADYLLEGPLAALDAIEQATGETEVNAIGYCIGGTLLASTLAYMAATNDKRIVAATFFTTLLDFTDVGDISVFIHEDKVKRIEAGMSSLGYMEGNSMAGAFNLLRENDLIWFFFVNNYLLGRKPAAFDILYWNSDSTRMPAAMQSYYLRNMYLQNRLREPGGITLANVPIDLRRIDIPVYFLSTLDDHIAPWQSTFAGTKLVSGPVRFVLGASGHVAGVINPPSANKYGYWTNDTLKQGADAWLKGATYNDGSWWSDWAQWIAEFGDGRVEARKPGDGKLAPIERAPGSYVAVRAAA
jgi:polyhydroxyalkanoate synthase